MTPTLLRHCVEVYDREAGISGLAAALDIDRRRLQRWCAGTLSIPAWVAVEIPAVLARRATELREATAALRNNAAECERLARELSLASKKPAPAAPPPLDYRR